VQALPGDVLWSFAQETPFNDERVALAVATTMDAKLRANGSRAFYGSMRGPELRTYIDQPPAPPEQAPVLLRAAGFPNGLRDLQVIGRCRVWFAAGAAEAGAQLPGLFQSALAELGLTVEPCLVTNNAAEAHLLVWLDGGPRPAIPQRQPPTFLLLPGLTSPPPRAVQPPATGSGGLR
jgi:hypothetical protein